METRLYKKEDVIELNEQNVMQIFQDCLMNENTPKENLLEYRFADNPNVPLSKFDYYKLKENKNKLEYLVGQLFYTHNLRDNYVTFTTSVGAVNYKNEAWTKNPNVLYAFYYLTTSQLVISQFTPSGITRIIDTKSTIPTLSPNDPEFAEWSKTHIEQ